MLPAASVFKINLLHKSAATYIGLLHIYDEARIIVAKNCDRGFRKRRTYEKIEK